MEIKFNLDTIIFYVQNVERLKSFYGSVFNFKVIEEYESSWALLEAGNCKIGLHQIGQQYWDESKGTFKFDSNAKIVFEIDQDINEMRTHFVKQNVEMKQIKTFDNYGYWFCDGEDPEGNVFQLKQKK
ncbi:putative enzyme related to lactoylglutathione lyase [Pedobacter cryoconitis]|uniref:VOC family protein n=1 Tax=Pedobacter cryoconitis TaxID=188932 RepID=UPI00161918CE|nr:VOC family protein [Pedobacter cryoconitis]MBB6272503.1 putative enzyme related to lactoylglutathione lyase [Pedobacter cryoconitis]